MKKRLVVSKMAEGERGLISSCSEARMRSLNEFAVAPCPLTRSVRRFLVSETPQSDISISRRKQNE
jgi:hypothetical protein